MPKVSFLIIALFTGVLFAQTTSTDSVKTLPAGYFNVAELREQLDKIIDDPNFGNAVWSVYVKSLETNDILYQRNQDKLLIPASTQKLLTSSSALLLLGSDFQYETYLYTDGSIKNGVLDGNLIIKGSGDPTYSKSFYEDGAVTVFEHWTDSLKQLGITKITGNIIGDDNVFDNIEYGEGWESNRESEWYSAPISGLSFNENTVEIVVRPTRNGSVAEVELQPAANYVTPANSVITNDEPTSITYERRKGTNLVSITGNINNSEDEYSCYVSIDNPTLYTATVFKEKLEENGIEISGYAADIDDVEEQPDYKFITPLFSYTSPPLKEIIYETNKSSNNFYAEQLIKTIGYELYGFGSVNNGSTAIKDLLKTMGINPDNIALADGSGLSRLNLLTSKQIVKTLTFMYKTNDFETFFKSLPIAGIDGSLNDRMKNSKAEKNVRAKPGYLKHVRTLAGYMKTNDGEPLAFAIIVNNFIVPSNLADYLQDQICIKLANFSRN